MSTRPDAIKFAPSILASDVSRLADEVSAAGADRPTVARPGRIEPDACLAIGPRSDPPSGSGLRSRVE